MLGAMKLPSMLVSVALAASFLTSTGCLVRTGRRSQGLSGHPDKHSHQHCHDRGGKNHKQVCHTHPHGPGHH
jgi:hypothetical protein